MPRRSPSSAIAAAAAMATALLLVVFVGGASAKLAVPPLDASASLSRLQPRSADRRRPERNEGKGWSRSQGASASAAAAAAAPKSVGSYHTSQRIQVGGPDAAVSGPPSKLPSTASAAARSGTAPGPPAAGLSPTALVLMALLAVQFGLQPLLVKKFTPAAVNRSTVVFVQEIVKLAVSVWAYLGSTLPKQRGEDWGGGRPAAVLRNLSVAGLPAALYCVQNLAALLAYQNLDPVAFNVLNQTKTLSAALCCYLVLGARQSGRQMLALGMLLAAALVLEKILPLSALIPGGVLRRAATDGSAAPLGSPLAALADLRESLASGGMARRVTHGVLPILLASFLSGLAGALVQRAVQGRGRQVAAGGGDAPKAQELLPLQHGAGNCLHIPPPGLLRLQRRREEDLLQRLLPWVDSVDDDSHPDPERGRDLRRASYQALRLGPEGICPHLRDVAVGPGPGHGRRGGDRGGSTAGGPRPGVVVAVPTHQVPLQATARKGSGCGPIGPSRGLPEIFFFVK